MSKGCPLCEAPIRINQRFCEECGECFSPCQEFKDTCNDYAKERNRLKADVEAWNRMARDATGMADRLEAENERLKCLMEDGLKWRIESRMDDYTESLKEMVRLKDEADRYREALERIISEGDYTAPELMKKWAIEALEE